MESLILRKGLSFFLQRVGWEVGLFLAIILALFDVESPAISNMTAPSGASGASSSGNWRQFLNFSSGNEGDSAPEQSTSSTWSGPWIGRWFNQEVAPNEGGHEATSQPTGTGVMEQEQAGPSNAGLAHSPAGSFPSAPRESPRPGIPPETGMPQEAPGEDIVHPIQPHIPQLDPPLIGDRERFRELQEQFQLYYLGRNGITDLAKFAGRLERCVPIERDIEAALVLDGYDPDRIRGRISEIRGRLFTHPNKALLLSERTLDEYLTEIRTNGTRGSRPYMRLVQAIRNSDILF
nr:hypothetical protein CFP56_79011 [Quercus suber]